MAKHRWTIPAGSEGFQKIGRDSALAELATLPPGEERTRWITLALAERGADTARQRMWLRFVEEDLPRLHQAAQDHDWSATSGEGLLALAHSQEDLFESSRGLSVADAPYLVSMRIYENAEALSPQHAEQTLRDAWTCLYFGFGAKAEMSERATETRPDGRPTSRSRAVKAIWNFLILRAPMRPEKRDARFRDEQEDLWKAWRDSQAGDLYRQRRRLAETDEDVARADEAHPAAALFLALDQWYGQQPVDERQEQEGEGEEEVEKRLTHLHELLRLLAQALDGQLDQLDQQIHGWMERAQQDERLGGLLESELVPAVSASVTTAESLLGHWDAVSRLEARDAALREALEGSAQVTDRFARKHGFGSAQEVRKYREAMDRAEPALRQLGTSSLHAAILILKAEANSTLQDIAVTLSLGGAQAVKDHLKRIGSFLKRG